MILNDFYLTVLTVIKCFIWIHQRHKDQNTLSFEKWMIHSDVHKKQIVNMCVGPQGNASFYRVTQRHTVSN
jgi:hypothetical protein